MEENTCYISWLGCNSRLFWTALQFILLMISACGCKFCCCRNAKPAKLIIGFTMAYVTFINFVILGAMIYANIGDPKNSICRDLRLECSFENEIWLFKNIGQSYVNINFVGAILFCNQAVGIAMYTYHTLVQRFCYTFDVL